MNKKILQPGSSKGRMTKSFTEGKKLDKLDERKVLIIFIKLFIKINLFRFEIEIYEPLNALIHLLMKFLLNLHIQLFLNLILKRWNG